ncbi:rRNA maturation RNase YbeY [Oleomonas cavernae]|nr:rRNA maturation RNase YbeY [Oleomonas cavernae]
MLTRAAKAAFAAGRGHLPVLDQAAGPLEIDLTLSSDEVVRRLNHQWRGKDKPTNVLSFPGIDAAGLARLPKAAPCPLGDVILALGTCTQEAAEQRKTLAAHAQHLVVHGVLHLLGYDHEDEGQAQEMEGLERQVLAGLGVADPYALADHPAEAVR